jgi:predicted Rossmann fold nucleotide-binding protein DprA/Smf involved in DNA uptake
MTAVDRTLAGVLAARPVRARKLAVLTNLPVEQVREGLRRLQSEGRAVSHDRRWVAA